MGGNTQLCGCVSCDNALHQTYYKLQLIVAVNIKAYIANTESFILQQGQSLITANLNFQLELMIINKEDLTQICDYV